MLVAISDHSVTVEVDDYRPLLGSVLCRIPRPSKPNKCIFNSGLYQFQGIKKKELIHFEKAINFFLSTSQHAIS